MAEKEETQEEPRNPQLVDVVTADGEEVTVTRIQAARLRREGKLAEPEADDGKSKAKGKGESKTETATAPADAETATDN